MSKLNELCESVLEADTALPGSSAVSVAPEKESRDDDGVDRETAEQKPEAVEAPSVPATAEVPLSWDELKSAATQRLDVDRRNSPSSAGLGISTFVLAALLSFLVGIVVQTHIRHGLSPSGVAALLTFGASLLTFFFCRSWFRQAWDERNQIIDAAVDEVVRSELHTQVKTTDEAFATVRDEIYAKLRGEADQREEQLQEKSLRELEKVRVFFESLLEKHVFRINRDLREAEAELERRRSKESDDQEASAASEKRLVAERDQLRSQLEEIRAELDTAKSAIAERDDKIDSIRVAAESDKARRSEEAAAVEAGLEEGLAAVESEIQSLERQLSERQEQCERLDSEVERLTAEAESAAATHVNFFDSVSAKLNAHLHLAEKLAEDLDADGENESAAASAKVTSGMREQLKKLRHLVRQVIDLGRLQSGVWKPTFSPVKVDKIVDEVVGELAPSAKKKGVRVELKGFEALPGILTDRRLLTRALRELIANALAYSDRQGRVVVSSEFEPGPDDESATTGGDLPKLVSQGRLAISVEDNGKGIAAGDLERVFEPFEQGDQPRFSLSGAGAGLGLALSRGYVEQLGGELRAASDKGRGSVFSFDFPIGDRADS